MAKDDMAKDDMAKDDMAKDDMNDTQIQRRGFMMVLSSPSGAGKTTLTRALLQSDPSLSLSISATTRKQRPNEREGIDYYFVDQARFDAMIAQNQLFEYATVFGNFYGTPRAPILASLEDGRDIIGDVDWQGTQSLAQSMASDLVTIFVLPPSLSELERRLTERNQDSPEVVAKRMSKARDEVSHWSEYEYVLVNHDLDTSIATLRAILTAERAKRARQIGLVPFVRRISADGQQ